MFLFRSRKMCLMAHVGCDHNTTKQRGPLRGEVVSDRAADSFCVKMVGAAGSQVWAFYPELVGSSPTASTVIAPPWPNGKGSRPGLDGLSRVCALRRPSRDGAGSNPAGGTILSTNNRLHLLALQTAKNMLRKLTVCFQLSFPRPKLTPHIVSSSLLGRGLRTP